MLHIAWSKTLVGRDPHNLADSAVATPDLRALGLPAHADLPRSGDGGIQPLGEMLGQRIGAPGGRVLVTAGASEANACVWGGLLEPGDEVLVEQPGYEPHRGVPPLFGLGVRGVPRHENSPLTDRIEAALGPASRMIVVSHVHNPSGQPLTEEEVARLQSLAERRDLWILCDETFRDASTIPLGTLATTGPRWIATGSLTKSYGLGGLRIGWVAGPSAALERGAMVQNALSVLPAATSVALTLELVPHLDGLRSRTHRILAANRESWSRRIGEDHEIRVIGPGLATTLWTVFGEQGRGDAFAEHALAEANVAVTPGSMFGDSSGIRVGLGLEPERFEPAMDSFERALSTFSRAAAPARARERA